MSTKTDSISDIAKAIAANKGTVGSASTTPIEVTRDDRSGDEGQTPFADILGYKPKNYDHMNFRTYKRDEWSEEVRDLIPISDPDIILDEEFAVAICMAIENDMSLLAFGPPGTGKTVSPKEVCARLGYPFLYIQGMGGTEPSDYVGQLALEKDGETTITNWHDGVASYAVRHGVMLLFDEPFKVPAQTNMCFQSLIDERRELKLYGHPDPIQQTLKAHPKFRMILCDNVRGVGDNMHKYAAEIQDQSTMDRLDMVVPVNYPPAAQEFKILKAKFPSMDETLIKKVIKVGNVVRASWAKDDVALPFTMRKTNNWLRHIKETGNIPFSFRLAYLNSCTDDEERNAVSKAYAVVDFGPTNKL